jgi:hypothetical protein
MKKDRSVASLVWFDIFVVQREVPTNAKNWLDNDISSRLITCAVKCM